MALQPAVGRIHYRAPDNTFSLEAASNEAKRQGHAAKKQLAKAIFNVGVEVGQNLQALKDEKARIASENRKLPQEIIQLKSIYVAEWDSTIRSLQQNMVAVGEKIERILKRLIDSQKEAGHVHVKAHGLLCSGKCMASRRWQENFEALLKCTHKADYKLVEKYPVERPRSPERATARPESYAIISYKIDAKVAKYAKEQLNACRNLEGEVALLRSPHSVLLQNKEAMMSHHYTRFRSLKEKAIVSFNVILNGFLEIEKSMLEGLEMFDAKPHIFEKLWELKEFCTEVKVIQDLIQPIILQLQDGIAALKADTRQVEALIQPPVLQLQQS